MQPYEHNPQAYDTGVVRSRVEVDQGLRAFMLGVYNHMILGLAISALTALAINYLAMQTGVDGRMVPTSFGRTLYGSPVRYIVMFAPLAFIFFMSWRSEGMTSTGARAMFYAFSAVMGVSLSWILIVYKGPSIIQVFCISAAMFGSLSLWAYTTKKDISAWGSFLFMGLIGLILASLVNLFIGSSAMQFGLSVIGVLVFAGLTAWDTQKLKTMYIYGNFDGETAAKASVFGALELYLDFINIFMYLLQLFGRRD